ncbi:hypothetical protein ETB97_007259 [Aspergillus alliaceus]|uniref:Uncharacterized protein n=1 Tax=Petromyces alliaceus TaxID=209559 RepID=A0A8H5ZY20_PETAA|nr:hypothetical protein ETB97_007259 [Aspergillus burnettii]
MQARSSAVGNYSSDVQLLISYLANSETLDSQKKDIIRGVYNELKLAHLMMTAFMRILYTNSLTTMQLWLKKMQRAYTFIAMYEQNIIGHAMDGFVFLQFTYDFLNMFGRTSTATTPNASRPGASLCSHIRE